MTGLNELQLRTLRAVLDCVIPPDDFPGAWDAGVGDYLARQFESDLAPQFEFYCAGLEGLEAESSARFGKSFSDLTSEQQIALLEAMESGQLRSTWAISAEKFFKLLVDTTAEGYYSDPEQGGNKNAVSWTMTGFSEHGPT